MHIKGLIAWYVSSLIKILTSFSLCTVSLTVFGLNHLAYFELKSRNALLDPKQRLLLIVRKLSDNTRFLYVPFRRYCLLSKDKLILQLESTKALVIVLSFNTRVSLDKLLLGIVLTFTKWDLVQKLASVNDVPI